MPFSICIFCSLVIKSSSTRAEIPRELHSGVTSTPRCCQCLSFPAQPPHHSLGTDCFISLPISRGLWDPVPRLCEALALPKVPGASLSSWEPSGRAGGSVLCWPHPDPQQVTVCGLAAPSSAWPGFCSVCLGCPPNRSQSQGIFSLNGDLAPSWR